MSADLRHILQSAEELDDIKSVVVDDVSSGKSTVLSLVESLEPYLVNKNELKRLKGTSFLSDVLQEISQDLLNEDEVKVLTAFFCDRLKDHFTVIPAALKGLQAVTSMNNLSSTAPDEILISLSQNITCQTLHQSSRLTYYNILQNLFNNKYLEVKKNSGDFVYSVVSAMDSESDPRNLMFLFNFLPQLFHRLEFEYLSEEAFTVLECYFPVDFNAKEKGAITRNDLAQGLENCFVSCENFGRFVIPLALEKLESSLKVAQMDSLKLLARGYGSWTIEAINPHVKDLWNSSKSLILPISDPELAEMAGSALVKLIQKYSTSPLSTNQSETLNQLLKDISTSSTKYLNDPTLSMFLPATKLLSSVSQSSAVACRHITKTIVSQLLVLLNFKTNTEVILATLCIILNATIRFNLWAEDENEEIRETLLQVPSVLISKLNDAQSQHGCFLCLNEIVVVLTSEMRLQIENLLLDIIPQLSSNNRDSCATFIKNISNQYPDEVRENVLSKLAINEVKPLVREKIDVLCWCTSVPLLMEYSIHEIIKCLENKSVSCVGIKSLRDYCENMAEEVVLHCLGTECALVQKLITLAKDIDEKQVDILKDFSKTIAAIVRCLLEEEQQMLISECIIQLSVECLSNNYLVLFEGILIPLRPTVKIDNCHMFINKLFEGCLTFDNETVKSSSSVLLRSIINKHPDGEDLDNTLGILSVKLNEHLKDESALSMRLAATSLLSCITKSLVLRGHRLSNQWLDKLIELLSDEPVQLMAANGFKYILTQSDDLSETNYCTIKLLHKQRVFCKMNKLISLYDNCTDSKKSAVSLAIAFILQAVPRCLVVSELKELVKVIVTCLDSNDHRVVAAILEVVSNLLESGEEVFEEQIQTFIPSFINCLQSTSMAVKMWSLECLYYYGKCTEIKILPYRLMVLNGVQPCLDDKKRLVRQRAVKVRTRWFLVGSLSEK
ncbi:MMS19 nucleotide excision repair protein homolog [Cimex lectularius]|uniref:MMS19 nucleotide excision repair protein n=1 Tax=Cimex lectularius TaxID=79782 RepID=A0A8I6TJG9_CIMLE|nr:MMS19 nucleotide excision repair protein homolog [Cimex lectularius]